MAIASNIQDLVKELTPATNGKPKTYTAEVSHTDEEGIVWVRLPGAEQDTPTASTSSEVKMGDTVTVEWRNNKLYIAGNYTNPSAGVERVANVEHTASDAVTDAKTAKVLAESARESAEQAITIAGDTEQHFWFTETGTDTGAHITETTQEDFLADPTNGGSNLLARSNGIAVRDGLDELASFSASGASIGQDGELRFFVTPSSIALENDDDEPIFSVFEDAAGKIVRPAVVATFADPTDVSTTTYTISDSITTSGAVAVFFETGNDQYALDSTLATTTVTAGSGVTVALTQAGVAYCQGLMTESEASGVLSAEYYITHYDKALLEMVGSISVDGVGDIIGVTNTSWTAANSTDTFIGADNTATGKGIRVGVGTGGQNRGLYDKTLERWIIYNNADGKTIVNGNNVVLSASGNLAFDGYMVLRTNNKSIYLTDAQAKARPIMYINANNAFVLGYGLYSANKGTTYLYGYDSINLRTNGSVTSNAPIEESGSAPRVELTSDSSGETLRVLSNSNGNKGLYNPDASTWLIRADSGFSNLYLGQEPILGDHSSPIGTVKRAYLASSRSINDETATAICSITLEKGVWMVIGYVRFPANSTGARRANISTTSGATDLQNQQHAGGIVMQMQVIYSATVTSTSQVFYLNAYQSSGAQMTLPAGTANGYINGMVATRIA